MSNVKACYRFEVWVGKSKDTLSFKRVADLFSQAMFGYTIAGDNMTQVIVKIIRLDAEELYPIKKKLQEMDGVKAISVNQMPFDAPHNMFIIF